MMLNVVYTALCAGIFWSCFCRLVRTNEHTHAVARAGFWVLGAASLSGAVAPWLWDTKSDWPHVAQAAGILILQAYTSRYWRRGVPPQFQKR